MPPQQSVFFKSVSVAFVCVLAAGFLISHTLYREYFKPAIDPRNLTVIENLPKEIFDTSQTNAASAKKKGLFFLSRSDFQGVGLRLLETPALFSSVFPGYEEALHDATFWNRYFRNEFEAAAIWSPVLNPSAPERLVAYSWPGCVSLFQNYGADVILTGPSQVFRAIIPSRLQQKFAPHSKILMCAKPHLSPEPIALMARHMLSTQKKAGWVVWGISAWDITEKENESAAIEETTRLLEGPTFWDKKLSSFFSPVAWLDLFHLTYSNVMSRFSPQKSYDLAENPEPLAENKIIVQPGENTFWFSNNIVDDKTIESLSKQGTITASMQSSLNNQNCDFTVASRKIDDTLRDLLKVADRVMIYFSPTSPYLLKKAPACLAQNIQRFLESKKSRRVFVMNADWKKSGLNLYSDFVYRFSHKGLAQLDPVHLNLHGAMIATDVIASNLIGFQDQERALSSHLH